MKRLILLVALIPSVALVQPAPETARADRLYYEVRCVQCQSQSIADSDAPIAVDMRARIREEIAAGRTDDQIRDGLRQRYGDYVLFRPRVTRATIWLWILPALIVLGGIGGLIWMMRSKTPARTYALSAEEQARLKALTDDSRRDS